MLAWVLSPHHAYLLAFFSFHSRLSLFRECCQKCVDNVEQLNRFQDTYNVGEIDEWNEVIIGTVAVPLVNEGVTLHRRSHWNYRNVEKPIATVHLVISLNAMLKNCCYWKSGTIFIIIPSNGKVTLYSLSYRPNESWFARVRNVSMMAALWWRAIDYHATKEIVILT